MLRNEMAYSGDWYLCASTKRNSWALAEAFGTMTAIENALNVQ